jgi:hypothetical protein
VEARRHADEAKWMALEQLERSHKDEEEAVAFKTEQDELL